jgi:hypothetical protein
VSFRDSVDLPYLPAVASCEPASLAYPQGYFSDLHTLQDASPALLSSTACIFNPVRGYLNMQQERHSGQAKRVPETIGFSGFPLRFIPAKLPSRGELSFERGECHRYQKNWISGIPTKYGA